MARTLVWATKASWQRLLSSSLLTDSGFDTGPLLEANEQIIQANAVLKSEPEAPTDPIGNPLQPPNTLCSHHGCQYYANETGFCAHHASHNLPGKLSLSSLSLPSKLPSLQQMPQSQHMPSSHQHHTPQTAFPNQQHLQHHPHMLQPPPTYSIPHMPPTTLPGMGMSMGMGSPESPPLLQEPSRPYVRTRTRGGGTQRKAQRSRNVYMCQLPGCTKFAQQSSDGKKTYCVAHMREKGMAPSSRCIHEGCEKYAMPSIDGSRVFCVAHQKERGMQPNLKRRMCQHPGCTKQARKSLNGGTTFCKSHMKFHGLLPNVPGCSHPGCPKQAQLAINGKTVFCKAHMKEHGLLPRQRSCGVPGCKKRAKQSWNGPATYCIAHMKAYGLVPKLRLCQHDACTKQAVPDTTGKRDFCVVHMKEHGLEPYFRGGRKRGDDEDEDEDEDDDDDY